MDELKEPKRVIKCDGTRETYVTTLENRLSFKRASIEAKDNHQFHVRSTLQKAAAMIAEALTPMTNWHRNQRYRIKIVFDDYIQTEELKHTI